MRTLIFCLLSATLTFAADVTGQWKATFDTQIGEQKYTYDLKAEGPKLTGKAIHQNGSSEVKEGKVEGNTIQFVEVFEYSGMAIRIEYSGTFDGADTIKFTRKVAEFAVEEFPAKRVK